MGIFSKKRKKTNQKTQMLIARGNRLIQIYNDSQKLFQETKNPDVFFSRFDLSLKSLYDLLEIINNNEGIKLKGSNVKKMIQRLEKDREKIISSFIHRYYDDALGKFKQLKTEKAKINHAIKSYEKLMKHSDRLSMKHVKKINKLWDPLLKKSNE